MARKNEAWGIEVGSQAIKALKLSRQANGVALEDFDVIPFKQILTTPDLNVEEAVRVNLDALIQKHELDKSQVVVSVPGHMAFARFAKLPPVEPSKVQGIVEYEARQQIPFPIEQVEWDYQVFAQDDAPDVEVGIFAITKERVAQFLSNYRAVDLRVDALTLSPIAVYNAFAYEAAQNGDADGTVYLDIGTVSTDIIIVESGGIWLRTLPLGGNHFTEALMKQFKISFARAEKLKKEASTSKYAKQIFQAMRGVFHDLVQEIQRSLGFYQSMNRDAELERVVGVGSTWKLPGLQKYLKQHLQIEVSRPDGFARIEADGKRAADFSSQAMTMATAYGLALQGLGLESVSANVLPQVILRQRMWKAKQPWIGAAAACVAIGAGVAGVTHFVKASGYDSIASDGLAEVSGTINAANRFKNEINEVVSEDPRPEIENYRRAFDYRDLMPKLSADLALALQAIEPQDEILSGDPEQIATIPRSDRRQIWIDEMTAEFKPMPGSTELPSDLAGQAASGQVFFTEATDATPRTGPTITLTIRGRTPMDRIQASQLIESRLVQWYRDNAVQADRPYEYVVADRARDFLPSLIQVGSQPGRTGTLLGNAGNTGGGGLGGGRGGGGFPGLGGLGGTTPGGRGGLGGVTPGGRGGLGGTTPGRGGLGGGLQGPGGLQGTDGLNNPGGSGTTETQAPTIRTAGGTTYSLGTNGWSMAALLPERPLSNEDSSQDMSFTITFDLILIPPAEARRTMTPGGRVLPGDEPAQPEPSADAANPSVGQSPIEREQEEQTS